MSGPRQSVLGVVLAGGGARGAYQAGVLLGVLETARKAGVEFRPEILSGTSIGAINAAWLAAHSDCEDHGLGRLAEVWRGLSLRDTVRPRWKRAPSRGPGGALLDPSEIVSVVQDRVPWDRLHRNLEQGQVGALIVTALQIATGRTAMFAETSPHRALRPSRDPRRVYFPCRLDAQRVLASAAFPWVFPPRWVDGRLYCDGGLRFNTPLAPALRSGASKLLVIVPGRRGGREAAFASEREAAYGRPAFLLGKLLNALLLDPVVDDLNTLDAFNHIRRTMEHALSDEQLDKLDRATVEARGAPYRQVDTLLVEPSEDLGAIAGHYLARCRTRTITHRVLHKVSDLGRSWEADLASFLLLDGEFCGELIALGQRDAARRAEDVVRFLSG